MAEEMIAPEWEHNYVLTWSGRWHIADMSWPVDRDSRRTLCGVYGYTRDHVPKGHPLLQMIKHGATTAPTCKHCEKKVKA